MAPKPEITLSEAVMMNTIQKLRTKLNRQRSAAAETEQHIAAIEQLIAQGKSTK